MNNKELTKLSFKVYPPMWAKTSNSLKDLCLNRDAYLSKLILHETEELKLELTDRKIQSKKAKHYLSKELARLSEDQGYPLQQISIQIPKTTAKALKAVVDGHNLYRDGFFNRMCVFLNGSKSISSYFELPSQISSRTDTNPFLAMEDTQVHPFYYYREHLQSTREEGIYTVPFPESIIGLSCYTTDDVVPDTQSFKNLQKHLKVLLDDNTVESAFSNEKKEIKNEK